uniref:Uncharacterized protein n=1 Tax=Oryza meridionalis TaxID=40149 RepID=A0A0E0DU04_9ORYZ
MDALNLGCICLFVVPGDGDGDPTATASAAPGGATRSGVASHLASMYRCFLHGAMCMPLSRAHCFAAAHMTRTTQRSRSARPTNASGISGDRGHLDLQIALLYPASRSHSARNRSVHLRQPPPPAAAARLAQEQAPAAAARICLMASSASAWILLSAELILASASYTSACKQPPRISCECCSFQNALHLAAPPDPSSSLPSSSPPPPAQTPGGELGSSASS